MTKKTKHYLVTTKYKGVFAGEISDDVDITKTTISMLNTKMAIRWGTARGLMELVEVGPNEKSKISLPADIPVLHGVTAVFEITDKAWEKWKNA